MDSRIALRSPRAMSRLLGLPVVAVCLFSAPAAGYAADCPNVDYRKGAGELLPDCRAYEQISPADKNGFDVESIGEALSSRRGDPASFGAAGSGTADGNAVAFQSSGAFGDAAWGGASRTQYVARRNAQNWQTRSIAPPISPTFVGYGTGAFSPDLKLSLFMTGGAATSDPISGPGNYYVRDNESGSIRFLESVEVAGTVDLNVAVADDPGHFVVSTSQQLSDESGQPAFADRVYEVIDGEARLVSRMPGTNEPFQDNAYLGNSDQTRFGENLISDDGRHVFFRAGESIYRRTDGTTTVLGSPSRLTTPDPIGVKSIRSATGDGNRLFFTSAERLTDDANTGTDLYRYDFAADELIDLSAGTAGSANADVQGVVGTSDDGSRAYFVASGQVVPGEGVAGGPNLYLWEDDGTAQGATRFIAALDPELSSSGSGKDAPVDEFNWRRQEGKRSAQVTPDGSVLVFQSRATLTGFDPTQKPGGSSCDYSDSPVEGRPCAQVYVYDADADGGAGDLACVSCNPNGAPADYTYVPTLDLGVGDEPPRFVSDAGTRVFFTSPDSLVPRDANGRYDAYVWQRHSAAGQPLSGGVSLLSSGMSGDDSYAAGASASGDDAFLRTRDQLVPQDGDTLEDLYTAHVGGGLPGQHVRRPAPCDGEACQGTPISPPKAGDPVSEAVEGVGNAKPGKRARVRVAGLTRKGKVGSGGRFGLRVRVTRPGRVQATVRSRGRVVARGSAKATKAGALTVRLKLNRVGRQRLSRAGTLRLSVVVKASGAPSKTVLLRARRSR